jgi:uncharacterized protein (DUF952 family)
VQLAFHLVPGAVWRALAPGAAYAPASLAEEGFIHLTARMADLIEVGNTFYSDDPRPYLVLTVDLDATGSPWRYDDAEERYPHVYGPIVLAAIRRARPMPRSETGRFGRPPDDPAA